MTSWAIFCWIASVIGGGFVAAIGTALTAERGERIIRARRYMEGFRAGMLAYEATRRLEGDTFHGTIQRGGRLLTFDNRKGALEFSEREVVPDDF